MTAALAEWQRQRSNTGKTATADQFFAALEQQFPAARARRRKQEIPEPPCVGLNTLREA